ncbi:radical SAM protein [Babesia caballi]|uniref:Radical SAM protein n=1 Tax=Babesia caballi TaxID=5871 RepID=A0AAV4LPC7_BABCB|nr:radical SAM protein [Babesia caballi]
MFARVSTGGGTDVGLRNFARYNPSKPTVLPTAFHRIVATHGIQEHKLELDGIRVVRKDIKEGRSGRVIKAHTVSKEVMKERFRGISGRLLNYTKGGR